MDRRTVAGRIKRAKLRDAGLKGKGQFYYVNEVVPLLVLAGLETEILRLGELLKGATAGKAR
ncbi:MAG: hypothetical protein R3E57_07715 [Porticoccaceae bacterium]